MKFEIPEIEIKYVYQICSIHGYSLIIQEKWDEMQRVCSNAKDARQNIHKFLNDEDTAIETVVIAVLHVQDSNQPRTVASQIIDCARNIN